MNCRLLFCINCLLLASTIAAQSQISGRIYPGLTPYAMTVLSNGNIAVSGISPAAGPDSLNRHVLLRLNGEGDVLSRQSNPVNARRIISSIRSLTRWGNGGLCYTQVFPDGDTFGNPSYTTNFYNEVGTLRQSLRIKIAEPLFSFFGNWSVISLTNGGIIVTGDTRQLPDGTGTNSYAAFLRFDAQGDLVYSKRFNHVNGDGPWTDGVLETPDGGLILLTTTLRRLPDATNVYVTRVDAAGNLVWSRRFDSPDLSNRNFVTGFTRGIAFDQQGNINFRVYTNESDVGIVRLTPDGDLLSASNYRLGFASGYSGADLMNGANGELILVQRSALAYRESQRSAAAKCIIAADGTPHSAAYIIDQNYYLQDIAKKPGGGYYAVGVRENTDCIDENTVSTTLMTLDDTMLSIDSLCYPRQSISAERTNLELNVLNLGSIRPLAVQFVSGLTTTSDPQDVFNLACTYFAADAVAPVTLQCNVENLDIPFLENTRVSNDGETILAFSIRLTDSTDRGTLFLPDGFPVEVTGNNTRSIRVETNYALDQEQIDEIVRAIIYRAPDFTALDGTHPYQLFHEWFCGEVEGRRDSFIVTSPPIFPGEDQDVDTVLCFPNTLTLAVDGPPDARFSWNTGDSSRTLVVAQSGDYAVTVSNFCGADSAFFRVRANDSPTLEDRTFQFELCPGDTLNFVPATEAGTRYDWDDGVFSGDRDFITGGSYLLRRYNGCSEATTRVNIRLLPAPPDFSERIERLLCAGSTEAFSVPFIRETEYIWSTGETDTTIFVDISGDYSVTATNVCGVDTSLFSLQASDDLPLKDTTIYFNFCLSDSIRFTIPGNPSLAYHWQDDSLATPERWFKASGSYVLESRNSCFSAETVVRVTTSSCCKVFVPTAFSPNGDGVNDVFRPFPNPRYCDLSAEHTLTVYDRWGGEILSRSTTGWNGNSLDGIPYSAGTYVYILTYLDAGAIVNLSGSIVLVR